MATTIDESKTYGQLPASEQEPEIAIEMAREIESDDYACLEQRFDRLLLASFASISPACLFDSFRFWQ
jgi:hypothetical protein